MISNHDLDKEYRKLIDFFHGDAFPEYSTLGLYTGLSGEILLFSKHYLATRDQRSLKRIHLLLDRGMKILNNLNHFDPSLSSGVAGFAWVVNFLISHEIIDSESEEILEIIDDFLSLSVVRFLNVGNIDLLNGAMGIAHYLIKREKIESAKSIVVFLDKKKIKFRDEITWEFEKKSSLESPICDLSLAHGCTGITYFLSQCLKGKVYPDLCRSLISGNVNFLLKNMRQHGKSNSFFANRLELRDYPNRIVEDIKGSRLAWCYGDLGMLYTLYNIAIDFNDKQLENNTLKNLMLTSKRKAQKDTGVIDAGFCHGAIGICYVFYKVFLKTGLKKFEDASKFWLEEALKYNFNNEKPDYGFSSLEYYGNSDDLTRSLLEGMTGVALVFQSILYPSTPEWDDCIMLS